MNIIILVVIISRLFSILAIRASQILSYISYITSKGESSGDLD